MSNNLKKESNVVMDIYRDRTKNSCMKCLREKSERMVEYELSDPDVEFYTDVRKFRHYMCENCNRSSIPNEDGGVYCNICNNLHIVTETKAPHDQDCRII